MNKRHCRDCRSEGYETGDPCPGHERRKMPDERNSITHKFNIHAGDGKYHGYITVGLYEDGSPGEVFIKIEVPGEPSPERATRQQLLNAMLDGIGMTTAIALQNGAELRSIVDKFIGTRFDPWGRTEHSQIARCTSVLDYVFRWLGIRFIDAKTYEIKHEMVSDDAVAAIVPVGR